MGIRQRVDWHRAELTPNDQKRQQRRDEYDTKYDMCPHGTHRKNACPGDEGN
jgi:hypothetical protein